MKKRILFLISSLNIGGTEKNVVNIVRHIDREHYEVSVCCLYTGGAFENEVRKAGVPLNILNYKKVYDPRIYMKLFRIMRNADVLHCFGYPTIYFGVLFGKLAGITNIMVAIQDRDMWKKWYHLLLDKLIRPLIDLYIADGRGTIEFAIVQQGLNRKRTCVIYDGADTEAHKASLPVGTVRVKLGAPEGVPLIALICRLDEKKKGVSYFIKAVPLILREHPDAYFLVVGDGEDREMLMKLSGSLNLDHRIIFAGFRTDLPDILNAIDILVISSLWESVPKVLVDAVTMGKVVVATKVGDIPEIIQSGKSGILVEPGNEHDIARSVIKLIEDEDMRVNMSANAVEVAERMGLTLKGSIGQLEDEYASISSGAKGKTREGLRGLYGCIIFPFVALVFLSTQSIATIIMRFREVN